jgi:hypothetical protein
MSQIRDAEWRLPNRLPEMSSRARRLRTPSIATWVPVGTNRPCRHLGIIRTQSIREFWRSGHAFAARRSPGISWAASGASHFLTLLSGGNVNKRIGIRRPL